MNKGKTGISLIILGNILYLAYIFFTGNEITPFSDFTSGLLLGLSVGMNLVGIILVIIYLSKGQIKKWDVFFINYWQVLYTVIYCYTDTVD